MSIQFPNVPLLAGVPAVLRRANALADTRDTLATADDVTARQVAALRWGVFAKDGTQVLEPDTFISLEHNVEYRISDYPVEGGSFESYDKVATPFALRVAMTKGGSSVDRELFFIAAQTLVESLDVYDVVTPERVYISVNVVRISRTSNPDRGAGLATVELELREVRAAAEAVYGRVQIGPAANGTAPTPDVPASATPPVTAAPGTTKTPTAVRKANQGAVQAKTTKRVALPPALKTTFEQPKSWFGRLSETVKASPNNPNPPLLSYLIWGNPKTGKYD